MLLQSSPHPTAIDWQYRATANGGNTHNLHRDAADRLCKGLDSTGLSVKAVEIYPFLGDNVPAVCTKLFYSKVGSSGYMSNVGFADLNVLAFGGLKDASNTARYLNTNLTTAIALSGKESTTGVHWYTRNTASSGTTQVIFNGTGSPTVGIFGGWIGAGTKESGGIATNSTSTVGTATSSVGFQGILNQNNRTTQYFLNGSALGIAGVASTGTWVASSKLLMFSSGTAAYWKRDALYGDVTVGTTSADEVNFSLVVRQFQRFLNRL